MHTFKPNIVYLNTYEFELLM